MRVAVRLAATPALLMALALSLTVGLLLTPGTARADDWSHVDYGPLAVVLDVSGSMDDDDGTGTVKLDGAKEALVSVVRSPSIQGDRIGLWTYPGGETVLDCAAGRWEQPVGGDTLTLAARINALTSADGGTPTGPALRAAADSLKKAGHTKAVILLVSDGMSNCGPPPCEVAKELVAEGFQLTVQAMGFQIDESGRKELECVAQVTQGSYHDAADAKDLVEKIEEYGVPRLTVKVDAPQQVASGDIAKVTVTVVNESSQTVPGVTVSVHPRSVDDTTILPAVIPPVIPIGNLPGKAQRSYTWTMPVGSLSKGGTASMRAVATSSGFLVQPATKDFFITALGSDFGVREHTWLSQTVADKSKSRILIFGDSYSSGEGAKPYDTSSVLRGTNECHRSRKTYLAGAGLQNVNVVACSGAVMAQVYEDGQWDQPPQVQHHLVSDTKDPVELAFMTVGGNDVQFADILTACLIGSDAFVNPVLACDQGWSHIFGTIALKRQELTKTYKEVYNAINAPELVAARGAIAPLVVLPYPNLAPDRATGRCGLDKDELRFARKLINALNESVENAVNDARRDGLHDGIIFASQVRTALGTHGMCTADPHFNNPTLPEAGFDTLVDAWDRAEWGHLDERGYLDVTRAIQSWAYTQNIDPTAIAPSPELLQGLGEWYQKNPSQTVPMNSTSMDSTAQVSLQQGDTIRVTASGLGPNSPALISIHSMPHALGTVWADETGAVDAVVNLPDDVELGLHNLVLEGFNSEFTPVTLSVPVAMHASSPWWLGAAPFVAGGLGLSGLVLLGIALIMRRRHA